MRTREAALAGVLAVAAAASVWLVAGRTPRTPGDLPLAEPAPTGDDARNAPTTATPRAVDPAAATPPTATPATTAPSDAQQPRGTRSVQGQVLRADGSPAPQARVEARFAARTDADPPPIVVTTGDDGTFAVAGLAEGRWALRAEVADYGVSVPTVAEAGASGVVLRMIARGWISGTFVGADGKAFAPDVDLWVIPTGPTPGLSPLPATVTADRFHVAGVAAGPWRLDLRARARGTGEAWVAASPVAVWVSDGVGTGPLEVALVHPATLAIHVVEAGTARLLAGATVRATIVGEPATGGLGEAQSVGGAGPTPMTGLAAGRWRLAARANGFAPAQEEVDVAGGATVERTIALARWATLRILVNDAKGRAAAGAIVHVRADDREVVTDLDDADATPEVWARTKKHTAGNGVAVLKVAPGEVLVSALFEPRHAVATPVRATARAGETTDVTLVVEPRGQDR